MKTSTVSAAPAAPAGRDLPAPDTGAPPEPVAAAALAPPSRRWGWRLANHRIRTKLTLLVAPPIAAVLALSGLIAYGAVSSQIRSEQALQLVNVGTVAGQLASELQHERAAAGLLFVQNSAPAAVQAFLRRAESSDDLRTRFTGELSRVVAPAAMASLTARLNGQLAQLPLLREQVRGGRDVTASVVLFRYRAIIADLIGYRAGLSQLGVDATIATGLRASATLSQGIEALGLLQVSVLPAVNGDRLTAAAQQQTVAANAAFTDAVESFRQLAPQWQSRLDTQTGKQAIVTGERLQALAVSSTPDAPLDLGAGAGTWASSLDARMDQLHAIERGLDAELLTAVTRQRDVQRRNVTILSAAVTVIVGALFAVGWVVTRSMTRPLRSLTSGATDMAATTLPALVAALSSWNADAGTTNRLVTEASRTLPVAGTDEISEVAAAFNDVAATAVRQAGDVAATQGVMTGVIEAIARQLQRRGDHVMAGIDALESHEEDPDRLKLLFNLDQQANGVYTLIDNLSVVAGGRAGHRRSSPVPLNDVLQAAVSRVDHAYERVEYTRVDASTAIEPEAAEEILHVLALLLDNAVRFTPPAMKVIIEAIRVGNRVHIQISDHGTGIPDDQLAFLRDRLATFRLDTWTARHMGLPVIGRIAARLGLTVELRSGQDMGYGICAGVIIPAALFTIDHEPPRRPAITAAATEPHRPASAPMAAASEPTTSVDALVAATLQLPIAGAPSPPPWSPTTPVALDPPRLEIFEQTVALHPYFDAPGPSAGAPAPGPVLPAQWTAANAVAERAARPHTVPDGPHETTVSGLPVRVPGQFAVPAVTGTPTVPAPRDRRAAGRGMAGLATSARASRTLAQKG